MGAISVAGEGIIGLQKLIRWTTGLGLGRELFLYFFISCRAAIQQPRPGTLSEEHHVMAFWRGH